MLILSSSSHLLQVNALFQVLLFRRTRGQRLDKRVVFGWYHWDLLGNFGITRPSHLHRRAACLPGGALRHNLLRLVYKSSASSSVSQTLTYPGFGTIMLDPALQRKQRETFVRKPTRAFRRWSSSCSMVPSSNSGGSMCSNQKCASILI